MTELTVPLQWSLENKDYLQMFNSLSQQLSGKGWLYMEKVRHPWKTIKFYLYKVKSKITKRHKKTLMQFINQSVIISYTTILSKT